MTTKQWMPLNEEPHLCIIMIYSNSIVDNTARFLFTDKLVKPLLCQIF